MTSPGTLGGWLANLDQPSLAELLTVHPVLDHGPPLHDLTDLAERLAHPAAVAGALQALPRPGVELLEVSLALGRGASVDRVTALLEPTGADESVPGAAVTQWLGILARLALAWPEGDQIITNPAAGLILAQPLTLGSPLSAELEQITVSDLQPVVRSWGVTVPKRRAELVGAIQQHYADPAWLRRLVASAPEHITAAIMAEVSRRLTSATTMLRAQQEDAHGDDAYDGPDAAGVPAFDLETIHREQDVRRWALEHGLMFQPFGFGFGYLPQLALPTEAVLTLAPPNYRIPFAWQPPALVSQEVSQTLTEQAGAAALHEILLAIMAVLESLLRRPAALLKSGGVGARELKRLAKALALPLQQVRLTIELAADLDLVTVAADGLVPSESFQQWRRLPLAQRAQPLLAAWLSCPRPHSLERDAEGAFVPALRTTEDGYLPTATAICTVLSELPTDRGVIGPEPVLEQLAWAHPLVHREPGWWEQAWQEAEWFGAVAQGRLTALGRAVVSEDSSQLPAVLEGLLPERSTEVLFGTDLTIVAPGSLPAEVIDLLDTVAHREGRGLAGTWRVSRSSVREALDDGETGVGLLETLGAVSGKPLPQPLKYLITDTANSYGRLQVREAAAVVVCPDEALLGQVAADTTLLGLGLVPVAPTVLLAGTDAPRVLAALRSAGYLPAEVDRDGRMVVELLGQQTATQRAAIRERPDAPSTATPPHTETGGGETGGGEPGDGEPGDGAGDDELAGFFAGSGFDSAVAALMAEEQREEPTQLAARLQVGEPPPGAEDNRELEAQVARYSRRLSQSEIRVLAHALASRDAVFLHYRSTTGGHTSRVVSGLVLQGGYLLGFCHLREQERTFRIDQIEMVTPLR